MRELFTNLSNLANELGHHPALEADVLHQNLKKDHELAEQKHQHVKHCKTTTTRGGSTQPWWAKMELYATKIWIPATVAGRPTEEGIAMCRRDMLHIYCILPFFV